MYQRVKREIETQKQFSLEWWSKGLRAMGDDNREGFCFVYTQNVLFVFNSDCFAHS